MGQCAKKETSKICIIRSFIQEKVTALLHCENYSKNTLFFTNVASVGTHSKIAYHVKPWQCTVNLRITVSLMSRLNHLVRTEQVGLFNFLFLQLIPYVIEILDVHLNKT